MSRCHDADDFEEIGLELAVLAAMRRWAAAVAPGDEAIAHAAEDAALRHFRSGASPEDACATARRLMLSRLRHPSHVSAPHSLGAA